MRSENKQLEKTILQKFENEKNIQNKRANRPKLGIMGEPHGPSVGRAGTKNKEKGKAKGSDWSPNHLGDGGKN